MSLILTQIFKNIRGGRKNPFSLLQRFEAIMALTDLSLQSAEAASRVAQVDWLLTKVEFLMRENHQKGGY